MQYYKLCCTTCEKVYDALPIYHCENCEGVLKVTYNSSGLDNPNVKLSESFDFLPLTKEEKVTLGEGNTQIIKATSLSNRLGNINVYLKCEFSNPTGSFKDRPVSIGISKAVSFGFKKVVAASSGNGASSVAAYAAKANLESLILVPENTPQEKVLQTLSYGAKVVKVKGSYSNCFSLAKELSEKKDYYNVTTTFYNPYTVEGDKTIGYEIIEDLYNTKIDYIFVPIGVGPLLVGIYEGFKDYKRINPEIEMPQMVGVQATGNKPIVEAFEKKRDTVFCETNPDTIAGGIADGLVGYEKEGSYTLNYIKKSNGFAIDVTDKEIMEAKKILARVEGLFVEPSAAASLAGLIKGMKHIACNKSHSINVVLVLTGHGLKDLKNLGFKPKISEMEEI